MFLTPDVAKSITEQFIGIEPVLSKQGLRKGKHVKYGYRFTYGDASARRDIMIRTQAVQEGITVYVNKLSVNGIPFPSSELAPSQVKQEYPKGYQGKTGDRGLSAAAAVLPTLAPKNNDVLRVTVPSDGAFGRLLDWYFGKAPLVEEKPYAAIASVEAKTELPSPVTANLVLPIDDDKLTGTGYERDSRIRKAVELYAVAKAREFYEKDHGYSVTPKGKPYDLLCEKPDEILHVEVKGSRYALDAIIVTINEVEDARNPDWNSDWSSPICAVNSRAGCACDRRRVPLVKFGS